MDSVESIEQPWAPAPAPVFTAISWHGLYIGVNLGYGWGDSKSSATGVPGILGAFDGGAGFTNGGISADSRGLVGGAQIGYNWQFNNLILGVEAEAGYLGLKERQIDGVGDANPQGQGFASARFGAFGTLTARVGFTFDRTLVYAKGGLAIAKVKNQAGDFDAGVIDLSDFTANSATKVGWTVGAGLEYAFTNNWRGRLEYQYMDFGDERSTNLDGDFFNHRNKVQTVRVGLNYYFTPVSAVMARY